MKTSYQSIEQGAAPAFFIQGSSPFVRLIFFSVLSLALIATDSRLQYLSALRHQFERYLHPLALMVNAPSELYRYVDTYLTAHDQLLAENEILRDRVLQTNVAIQSVQSLQVENDHLRGLFNVQKHLAQHSILGDILHASSNQLTKSIVINRGVNHGAKLGAAVIDANGIIGQVTDVYPKTSVVTLITNKSLEIPVIVERNGLRAIAFGHGQSNLLEIPYLPANVDIHEGDKLMTSGIDNVYPPNVAVGIVQTISIAPGSTFIRIVCAPVGGLNYHRQVLIVNPKIVPVAESETDDSVVEKTVAKTAKSPISQSGVINAAH